MKRIWYLIGLLVIGALSLTTAPIMAGDHDSEHDNGTFPNGNDRTKTETIYLTETTTSLGTVTQNFTQTITTTLPPVIIILPAITTTLEVTLPAVTLTQTVTTTYPPITLTLPALTQTLTVTLPAVTLTETVEVTETDTVTSYRTVTNNQTAVSTVTKTITHNVPPPQPGTINPYLTFPCPPTLKMP